MEQLNFPIRSDKLSMTAQVTARIADRRTEFQRIEVLDTVAFGRLLLLDGHIQLTELDEHAYHEALVHIPMLSMASPKRALVVGGGDGGVLRELVKHPSLERIDMVEIDAGVIEVSREFLPGLSAGAFDDPRVQVHVADAFPYVKGDVGPYDLIVLDSTDTYEEEDGGLSEMLFTSNFYQDCLRILAPSGMVVTQADNLVFCPYSLEEIQKAFAAVFPMVGSYQAIVPSFGGFSGYCWASKGAILSPEWPVERAATLPLRYLNAATWAYAQTGHGFSLPA
ncbi:MAG: hypothetical protein ACOYON_03460 [Fimbriimonas sp.]